MFALLNDDNTLLNFPLLVFRGYVEVNSLCHSLIHFTAYVTTISEGLGAKAFCSGDNSAIITHP